MSDPRFSDRQRDFEQTDPMARRSFDPPGTSYMPWLLGLLAAIVVIGVIFYGMSDGMQTTSTPTTETTGQAQRPAPAPAPAPAPKTNQ
jgi:hypothetical protein